MLNRAIAYSKVHGPEAALRELAKAEIPGSYYLYHVTTAALYMELSNYEEAERALNEAMTRTISKAEKDLLQLKLQECKDLLRKDTHNG